MRRAETGRVIIICKGLEMMRDRTCSARANRQREANILTEYNCVSIAKAISDLRQGDRKAAVPVSATDKRARQNATSAYEFL